MEKKYTTATHILPSIVQVDLNTGERKVLKYVELTDKQYHEQFIEPFARILNDMMQKDIKSGRFNPHDLTFKETEE